MKSLTDIILFMQPYNYMMIRLPNQIQVEKLLCRLLRTQLLYSIDPLNYQFTHALEAQGKESECSACHTERSFCIECHRDNNILPHNHTAGWINTIDGGRHKTEAEIDLESCMACHEQNADQICQPCHDN